MICEWGMSEKLGTVSYTTEDHNVFLARDISHPRSFSEETAALIDAEVKRIIDEQLDRGRELLKQNKDKLERIAKTLLESETINGEELNKIIRGEKLPQKLEKSITLNPQEKAQPNITGEESFSPAN
jgi:cell division protease FtsH